MNTVGGFQIFPSIQGLKLENTFLKTVGTWNDSFPANETTHLERRTSTTSLEDVVMATSLRMSQTTSLPTTSLLMLALLSLNSFDGTSTAASASSAKSSNFDVEFSSSSEKHFQFWNNRTDHHMRQFSFFPSSTSRLLSIGEDATTSLRPEEVNTVSTLSLVKEQVESRDQSESLNLVLTFANSSELDETAPDEGATTDDKSDFDFNFFNSIMAGSVDGSLIEAQNNYYNNDTFLSGYDNSNSNDLRSSETNDTTMEQNAGKSSQVYIMVGVSVATIVLCLLAVFGLGVICRRHMILSKYNSLPSTSHSYLAYDYIYRPLHGNRLDDEYENTFVGVSIPLLQEVSVI